MSTAEPQLVVRMERTKAARTKSVSAACDVCRAQKRKCDGLHPCARCLKLDKNCTYTPQKPRGVKSKQTPDQKPKTDTDSEQLDIGSLSLSDYENVPEPEPNLTLEKIQSCIQSFQRNLSLFFHAVDLDALLNTADKHSPDKQFLLLCILANGAACNYWGKMARRFGYEAEVILVNKLRTTCSRDVCLGLFLLSYYYCGCGQSQRSQILDFSAYKIAQKMASNVNPEYELLFRHLQCRSTALLLCKAAGKEEMDEYLQRGRKLAAHPVDILYLFTLWCRNQVTHAFFKHPWASDKIFPILDEMDQHIAISQLIPSEDNWIYKMYEALATAIRAAALWNVGQQIEAIEKGFQALALVKEHHCGRKIFGFGFSLAFVIKMFIEAAMEEQVKEALYLLHAVISHTVPLPEDADQSVEEALAFLNEKNPTAKIQDTPGLLCCIKRILYTWDEAAFLSSIPGSLCKAKCVQSFLTTEFPVDEFLNLGVPELDTLQPVDDTFDISDIQLLPDQELSLDSIDEFDGLDGNELEQYDSPL